MKPRAFFDLVSSMRAAQKEFFHTRSVDSLRSSKELEKKVDAEIKRVNDILERQSNVKTTDAPVNKLTGHTVTLEDLEDNYYKCSKLCGCKNCDFQYGGHDECFDVQEKVEKLKMALKSMN